MERGKPVTRGSEKMGKGGGLEKSAARPSKNDAKSGQTRPNKSAQTYSYNRLKEIGTKHDEVLGALFSSDHGDCDGHIATKLNLNSYKSDLEATGIGGCNVLHALVKRLDHEFEVQLQYYSQGVDDQKFEQAEYEADNDEAIDMDEGSDGEETNNEETNHWEAKDERIGDYESDDEEHNDEEETSKYMNTKARRILEFVEHMVVLKPGLICQPNIERPPTAPIELFARSYPAIIFHVIAMLPSQAELEALKQKCKTPADNQCPLKQINVCLRDHCINLSTKMLPTEKPNCWHPLVNMANLERKVNEIRNTLKGFIVASEETQTAKRETLLHLILGNEGFDSAAAGGEGFGWKSPEQLESFKKLLDFFPESERSAFNREHDGLNPLQTVVLHFKQSSLNYNLLHKTIKVLVNQQPNSIHFRATNNAPKGYQGKTAYDLLRELQVTNGRAEEFKTKTEYFLKKTCLRQKDPKGPNGKDVDKIQYLYPTLESQRYIRLDLAHDTSTIIDSDYVEILEEKAAMQFENILECVRLPYRPPPPKTSEKLNRDPNQVDEKQNLDPYTSIFSWLRQTKKVRKIFKVEVDDLGSNPLSSELVPHTNKAIRKCLNKDFGAQDSTTDQNEPEPDKGLGVEEWDWRKFDIPSDTIVQAAPGVRILSLYSSGNTGVLQGWACEDGIRRLKKLQHVHVTVHPKNAEDEADCRRYKPIFEAKIGKGKGDNFVKTDILPAPGSRKESEGHLGGLLGGERDEMTEMQSVSAWIRSIFDFKGCVSQVLDEAQAPDRRPIAKAGPGGAKMKPRGTVGVKVAIIDDGVILQHESVQGIKDGKSFSNNGQVYFGGNCKHGTQMVSSLRAVCPMAELYVARLDDSRKTTNQRFTVSSAIKALKWAIGWKVDIISMSWSFEDDDNCSTAAERKEFKDTINEAASKGIILFGAMPDRSNIEDITKRYPAGLKDVIRITGATESGGRLSGKNTNTPELLFPGHNVKTQEGADEATGSSVATALAAGFAALTLLCIRLQLNGMLYDGLGSPEQAISSKRLESLMDSEGIRAIFKRASKNSGPTDDVVVQPSRVFPKPIPASPKAAILDFLTNVQYERPS